MLDLLSWCQWLEHTSMATVVSGSPWLFPAIETLHLMGIVALVGSTSILDLRLLGLVLKRASVSKLTGQLLPWAWAGFAIQLVTGFVLFASEASKVYVNGPFRIKMLMILLAGINALIFHVTTNRRAAEWENDSGTPFGAKIAGFSSIALWFGIVITGRLIAFFGVGN